MTSAYFTANVCGMRCIPLVGLVVDRLGRRPVLLIGLSCELVFITVYFWLLGQGGAATPAIAMIVAAGLINPICFAAEGSFITELFDTRVRFSGASLAKQLGGVLGGGLVPVIATTLAAAWGGSYLPVAAYIVVLEIAAIIAIALSVETKNRAF